MKSNIKYFALFLVISFISSCDIQRVKDIDKAEWIIGVWENKTSNGCIYEAWSRINENEFYGKSYAVKDIDTIIFETINFKQETNALFYIPSVKNQNNGEPIKFVAKAVTDTQFICVNPKHDFPQIITYTKITQDSLLAEISGKQNGQYIKRSFPMKRVK